jgi:hypothetical protein
LAMLWAIGVYLSWQNFTKVSNIKIMEKQHSLQYAINLNHHIPLECPPKFPCLDFFLIWCTIPYVDFVDILCHISLVVRSTWVFVNILCHVSLVVMSTWVYESCYAQGLKDAHHLRTARGHLMATLSR